MEALKYYRGPDIPGKYEGEWEIRLTKYERDNLLFLLNVLGFGDRGLWPFYTLNNGDWIGQIAQYLSKPIVPEPTGRAATFTIDENDSPNTTRKFLKQSIISSLTLKLATVDGNRSMPFEEIKERYQPKAIAILEALNEYADSWRDE